MYIHAPYTKSTSTAKPVYPLFVLQLVHVCVHVLLRYCRSIHECSTYSVYLHLPVHVHVYTYTVYTYIVYTGVCAVPVAVVPDVARCSSASKLSSLESKAPLGSSS